MLSDVYPGSAHVSSVGLAATRDRAIWTYAGANDFVLVSKDEDFADLARQGATGPAVIWMHTGNGTTRSVLHLLDSVWPLVEIRLDAGDRLVEVR